MLELILGIVSAPLRDEITFCQISWIPGGLFTGRHGNCIAAT